MPVSPGTITSGTPPTRVPTTASPEAIAAPHQSVSLVGGSRRFNVEFKDGEMFVDDVKQWKAYWHFTNKGPILPEDFPRVSGQVVMTTGSHHMQLYWIKLEDGGLEQLSWTWLIRDQRWVPGEMVYLQPPDGPAGLTGTWELNCIKCHATGGQPRAALAGEPTPPPDPRAGELGIACEACHGPGAEHVAINQNPARRYALHLGGDPDPTIVNPNSLDPKRAAEACAACHGGRLEMVWDENEGGKFTPGEPIEDFVTLRRFHGIPEDKRHHYFWAVGTSRVTGREYTALSASECFVNGDITCSSCHSMHDSDPNDQLRRDLTSDQACLQCHPQIAPQIVAHTHHAKDSPGSRCNSCHMPNTTYGLLSLTSSHRVDSPSAKKSAETGRPNACNLCHLDKPLSWADERIATWYDKPRNEFSAEENEIPAGALWLLKGDAVQRATAAWHFGWEPAMKASGTDFQAPLLARSLDDSYAAVRYLAERSLRKFEGFEDFAYDFTRPVRVQGPFVEAALAISAQHSGSTPDPLDGALIARLMAERDNSDQLIRE